MFRFILRLIYSSFHIFLFYISGKNRDILLRSINDISNGGVHGNGECIALILNGHLNAIYLSTD